jgi:hypothetical protein
MEDRIQRYPKCSSNKSQKLLWREDCIVSNYYSSISYFAFLALYTKYLIYPGFFGLIVLAVQRAPNVEENDMRGVTAVYCCMIIIWSTIFIEHWKRKEATFAVQWGQTDFFEDEQVRPTFRGEFRRSPINDDPNEMFYSSKKRMLKTMLGFGISLIMLTGVIFCVISIL